MGWTVSPCRKQRRTRSVSWIGGALLISSLRKTIPILPSPRSIKSGWRNTSFFPRVTWGPKSEAIKSIVAEMDLSADTFAFVDDQPFERGEIKELIPDIAVF